MSLVGALNLVFLGVVKAAFSDFRKYTKSCHDRGTSSPKVVWSPLSSREEKCLSIGTSVTHDPLIWQALPIPELLGHGLRADRAIILGVGVAPFTGRAECHDSLELLDGER
ncbi:hypothetical protein D3C81_1287290 [compost metagenome]